MVEESEFLWVRIQINLIKQVCDLKSSSVVSNKGQWNDTRYQPLAIVLDDIEQLLTAYRSELSFKMAESV